MANLLSSRIGIINSESKRALETGIKKAIPLAAAIFCLLVTWLLLLAGGLGLIAAKTTWPWFYAAFAAAGLHILVMVILLNIAKSRAIDAFPLTRAEFKKDREWLNQLKQQPKSES
ncbi:MAG: phage holin family protein [Armatimonadetes bacterium]|nr:phage holin family protein [Akkermansiaceae bacterium]